MNQQLKDTFLTALEQYQHKLLRICSVYAEDEDDKKDLFQESLIHIWQAMPSFEARSSISTWMFRITLNVCLRLQSRELKKRNRFIKMESIQFMNIGQEENNPEQQEQLTQLRNCIRKLNDADKALITLYLEELSYREISGITGIVENTIAVKIKRIKDKLLNCITQTI